MPRSSIPTWCFAVTVVRKDDRFLLVHERKHGSTWYLPAGRVEPGETFFDAALRETLEETGVPVTLDGILRIEHKARADSARFRVIFVAHPAADVPPKSTPDDESLGAGWFTLDQLTSLPLRGPDVQLENRRVPARGTEREPSPQSQDDPQTDHGHARFAVNRLRCRHDGPSPRPGRRRRLPSIAVERGDCNDRRPLRVQ